VQTAFEPHWEEAVHGLIATAESVDTAWTDWMNTDGSMQYECAESPGIVLTAQMFDVQLALVVHVLVQVPFMVPGAP
jgi:hypothetical protein